MKNLSLSLKTLTICLLAHSANAHSGTPDVPVSYSANQSSNPMCSHVDPYPAVLVNNTALAQTQGVIQFAARDGNVLDAYTYKASQFTPQSGKILFVLHGVNRDADAYLDTFKALAERHDALVIAPQFPTSYYPQSSDYTLGVKVANTQVWRNSEDFLYSEIEHLFEGVKQHLNSSACGYHIFGHSAGAQFLHRLNTFVSDNRIIRGVAANSGWYTLTSGLTSPTANNTFPYGVHDTPVTVSDLQSVFNREMVVLVGENDTVRNSQLRQTPEADHQGQHRRARGGFYYQDAATTAQSFAYNFNWEFDVVANAEHDKDHMAASAAWYLFNDPQDTPCVADTAQSVTNLVVNEIHADPVSSSSGDANGDGSRDNLEDEFIEFANSGAQPICIAGWSISDASGKIRHSFPIGSEIQPGKSLVVFGGGIPTGAFGNTPVQTALYGTTLSLTNGGDIITIRDANGAVEKQLSWGDCDDQICEGEYIQLNLGRNRSVSRYPEISGTWHYHTSASASGARFSPGTKADGMNF